MWARQGCCGLSLYLQSLVIGLIQVVSGTPSWNKRNLNGEIILFPAEILTMTFSSVGRCAEEIEDNCRLKEYLYVSIDLLQFVSLSTSCSRVVYTPLNCAFMFEQVSSPLKVDQLI